MTARRSSLARGVVVATATAAASALLALGVPAFAADAPPAAPTVPVPDASATGVPAPGATVLPTLPVTPTPTPSPTVTGVPQPPLAPPIPDPTPVPGAVVVPLAPLPPTPDFPAWIDDFARYQPQFQCATAPQPGTAALQALLSATYGLTSFSSVRPCNGSISEHHDGRALDVMLKASKPQDRATAYAILGWLLGPDKWGNQSAVARRLGVMYVIFDHYIWRAYRPEAGWLPYFGTESHDDHIHISLSFAGGLEQTSWWSLDPMTIPGVHLLGTRWWRVSCAAVVEPGARCTADIKATQNVWNAKKQRFLPVVTWLRNRTTTVATVSPSWDAAPTGHTGDSTTPRGAALHTVCTDAAPAPRVCRTSELTDVVVRLPDQSGAGTAPADYGSQQKWVLRSVVKLVAPVAPPTPVPTAASPAPLRRR